MRLVGRVVLLCMSVAMLGLLAGPAGAPAAQIAEWKPLLAQAGIFDIAGPRRDGRYLVAGNGRLFLFRPGDALAPFAGGYSTDPNPESYIALTEKRRVPGAGCSFRRDDAYALDPGESGIVKIPRRGDPSGFAELPAGTLLRGIAFDQLGRFDHRLLVNAQSGGRSTLYAVDCAGRTEAVVDGAPTVEGGMGIAPRRFGRFVGRLIAPSELDSEIYAFGADGSVRIVADSGLPGGPDQGVEGVGFAPRGFGAGDAAYMADAGTSTLLMLRGGQARRAGVRGGDLLAPAEVNPGTVRVRCSKRGCDSRLVATGSSASHREGHVVFGPAP